MADLDLDAKRNKRKFPQYQEQGIHVYDTKEKVFRDNSEFVSKLISRSNVLFTRPPQLGKTTLLSLAELMLSNTATAPEGLKHYPCPKDKNQWYVLYMSFGSVMYTGDSKLCENTWEEIARNVDHQVEELIRLEVNSLLNDHEGLRKILSEDYLEGKRLSDVDIGLVMRSLARAIASYHKRKYPQKKNTPTLLLLVDEYDKPIRQILFDFVGKLIPDAGRKIKTAFARYCQFFSSCKHSANRTITIKTWVTGITPVGLNVVSDFRYEDVTFDAHFADAVGLLDSDIENMLKEAIAGVPSNEAERAQAVEQLRFYFNNLGFPEGSHLYHTGMMNSAMQKLQESGNWREWLANLSKITTAEEVPSNAFDIIRRAEASDLRALVKQLVDQQKLTGFEICDMTITNLLEKGDLGTNQYLTLLVHLGIVSATYNDKQELEFKSTSEVYRRKHLTALNYALASSIRELLALKSKEEMYNQGIEILKEFLSSLSQNKMKDLIAWAGAHESNRILELQWQGNIVESLFKEFEASNYLSRTTQEDKLESGRSDITVMTERCIVVLELKKKDGSTGPTAKQWERYHDQLRGYVEEHRKSLDTGSSWVAGFVLVMYNKGKNYEVRKLSNDDD